ncbi:MAG TPA: hypothetical protein VLH19_02310 [Patescibacteria group bacterium]|nr:hypothetical protein [Patescibacteria group bacterium]
MSTETESVIVHISLEQAGITFDKLFKSKLGREFNGSEDDIMAVVPMILLELSSPYSSNPFYLRIIGDKAEVQILHVLPAGGDSNEWD